MTKSVIGWICTTYFCYLLQPVSTVHTTYTSKACYGADPPCTRHVVSCNPSQKIAISEAYYTNNTECGSTGVSACGNLIPDNVIEQGYHRFNNSELVSLYRNCSTKSQCVYRGPRREAFLSFSVVKYRCIEENDSLNISGGVVEGLSQAEDNHGDKLIFSCSNNTYVCNFKSNGSTTRMSVYALDVRLSRPNGSKCLSRLYVVPANVIKTSNCSTEYVSFERLNITEELPLDIHFKDVPRNSSIWLLIKGTNTGVSHVSTTHGSILSEPTDTNTGAIVGGVVATILALLVVTVLSVWIIRHSPRRETSGEKEKTASLPKDAKHDMTYSLAGIIPQNNYHEIQNLKTQNSDYDYATADGMVLPPTTNSYYSIEPRKQTAGDSSKASESEGDYDHLGDKPSPQTSDYDTTASVAPPGHIGEDGYGYNHFQKKTNTQTHQNDYDTAASATKEVAQISTTERITDEDDYDHFQRGANAETVSSPYDTTSGIKDNSDYSVK